MIWVLKSGGVETTERIGLAEACVEVLVQAGQPLHRTEIMKRVVRMRGIGDSFSIRCAGKLARVGPSMWGLLDRDFILDAPARARFLADLESKLAQRAVGLRVSELAHAAGADGCASGATNYMLMGLAQSDARFSVSRGGFIALARWNRAGRSTVRASVGRCVSGLEEVAVPELVLHIAEDLGRQVQPAIVIAVLRQMGWRRRDSTDTFAPSARDDA